MKRVLAGCAALLAITALADPPSSPAHPERDYRPIGGGLYLRHDQDLEPEGDGNITVTVFSARELGAGGHYSFDLSAVAGVPPQEELKYDGGTLGELRGQFVTLDCVHRTYEVVDVRKLLPDPIWRPAASLPKLAPVFRYVCSRAHQESSAQPAQSGASGSQQESSAQSAQPGALTASPPIEATHVGQPVMAPPDPAAVQRCVSYLRSTGRPEGHAGEFAEACANERQ